MTWRFRRSVQVAPGVRLNYGKRGTSLSIGGHGMTTNIGPQGAYTTTSIPGTGISYRQQVGGPLGQLAARSPGGAGSHSERHLQWKAYAGWQRRLHGCQRRGGAARGRQGDPPAGARPDSCLAGRGAKECNAAADPLLTVHHTSPPPMDTAHYMPPAFPTPQPQPPVFQETPPLAPLALEDPNWLEEHVAFLRERVEEHNEERQAEYAAGRLRGSGATWRRRKHMHRLNSSGKPRWKPGRQRSWRSTPNRCSGSAC